MSDDLYPDPEPGSDGTASFECALIEFVDGLLAASADGPVKLGERHPVLRTGERGELSPTLRWLIWHRDRGRCQICGAGDTVMELDHVIPWSAGGGDVSTNLRVLCSPCNQDRSNFRTFEPIELVPVAAICDACMIRHEESTGRAIHGRYLYCPVCNGESVNQFTHPNTTKYLAFCGCCRRRATVTDPKLLL